MKYHFGFRYWREPTPTKIRRVFTAISSAGIASCGFAILRDHYELAIFFLACATGGAFIAKLFAEKP